MNKRKDYWVFKIIRGLIDLFYPNMTIEGMDNLPQESVIIVGNHTQMNGPIACELYFSDKHYTWCAGEMMDTKSVPAYAYQDFWSQKPRYSRWFYKILSYIITPPAVCIFNNARTIGVYHDARLLSTFKDTIKHLQQGDNIIIFPEHDVKYNHIVYEFQEKFIDVAKLYHKKTGKELLFVPLYIAPKLKKMYLGEPIRFCAEREIEEERRRISAYLMRKITEIACELPRHKVIPYRNIKKRDYPYNIAKGEEENEKAGC